RGGYPVLYGSDETFPIGGSKVLRSGDRVTIVGAGVTVHQALAAAEREPRRVLPSTAMIRRSSIVVVRVQA
ncbi:MAG: hypothetical protein L0I06_07895, partial [Acidipropionibacterium jensenii]|nr:hypothetical protein [Acidipropionibacterium jensenii]